MALGRGGLSYERGASVNLTLDPLSTQQEAETAQPQNAKAGRENSYKANGGSMREMYESHTRWNTRAI